MILSLPALLVLLTPLLVAILVLRPSWPEYFLLTSPVILAILVALFAFSAAVFTALGVIGLLILLCALSMEAEDRGVISGSTTAGVLGRILGMHERENFRHGKLSAQRRRFWLAQAIGAEFVALSLITWFLSV